MSVLDTLSRSVAIAGLAAVALYAPSAMAQQQGTLGIGVSDSEVSPKGAIVTRVAPGGAAATAGLLTGDVVTAMDGKAVTKATDLAQDMSARHAGDVVTLHVVRSGAAQQVDIRVTLGAAAAATKPAPPAQAAPKTPAQSPATQGTNSENQPGPGAQELQRVSAGQ
jgi:S1-C subfamily serine protease